MAQDEGKAPKWRRRKEARPTEIVEAALDVFAERGFAATRLEDVAERAGVSKGTLYLYFRNKEDLFKAVIQLALVPNIALAEGRLAEDSGTTEELLNEIVGNFIRVVAGSKLGAIPKLIISEAHNFPDLTKYYVEEVIGRGLKIVTTVIQRGIERGEIRAVDANLAAPVVVGPLLLLAIWKNVFEPHAGQTIDPVSYIKTYSDILLNGLRMDPASKEGR